jgi:hypothetical protein
MRTFARTALLMLLTLPFAHSQVPDERGGKAPDGVQAVPVVIGKPYTGRLISEHAQVAEDGTKSPGAKFQVRFYRDGEGRSREEKFPPINAERSSIKVIDAPMGITIVDPVEGFAYILNPDKHTATRFRIRGLPQTGSIAAPTSANPGRSSESLGTKLIDGLNAEGTRAIIKRSTEEYPSEPDSEEESWWSPDLLMPVLTIRKDPFFNLEVTERLTEIRLGEPEHSLFKLPSDYILQEK